jgi:hypothetical protein
MKKVFIYIILIMGALTACENQPLDFFPNYNLKAVYFPVQLPLRTLSLGEDRIDNTLDKEFKFHIGVSIGGMNSNTKDWTVDYVVDNTLADKVYTNTTPSLKIQPLPSAYYKLSPLNTVTIPSGSFNGLIEVQLTDAFFNDTVAILGTYVIPLKITGSSADSILMGQPLRAGADPRIAAQWVTNKSPKNWTMYGIKYVNAYHGNYLHRGRDIRRVTATNVPYDTIRFRNPYGYVEKDALINLKTVGRRKAMSNGLGGITATNRSMILEFTNDFGTAGAVTIKPSPTSLYAVTGTGEYHDIASSVEKWTGLTWQSMYLNYTYVEGIYTHQVNDTLVFRDRGMKYEVNAITIVP